MHYRTVGPSGAMASPPEAHPALLSHNKPHARSMYSSSISRSPENCGTPYLSVSNLESVVDAIVVQGPKDLSKHIALSTTIGLSKVVGRSAQAAAAPSEASPARSAGSAYHQKLTCGGPAALIFPVAEKGAFVPTCQRGSQSGEVNMLCGTWDVFHQLFIVHSV